MPFLYLLVMLAAIARRAANRTLRLLATLCTGLTAAQLVLPELSGVGAFGQSNRLIFALLLWALLGLEFIRRGEALRRVNEALRREVAERRRAETTISTYAGRLQGLTARLVEVQESERKALAEALHDRIGHHLSSLNLSLSLGLARAQLPDEVAPRLAPRLDDALALVEQTTELVRDVMEELHPALLDQYGLEVALRWYGDRFAQRSEIVVDSAASALFPRLAAATETNLFRIAQEALTNVAEHTFARRIAESLQRHASGIELAIADDGVGIPPASGVDVTPAGSVGILPPGSGWGLNMCEERARDRRDAAGGRFEARHDDKGRRAEREMGNHE